MESEEIKHAAMVTLSREQVRELERLVGEEVGDLSTLGIRIPTSIIVNEGEAGKFTVQLTPKSDIPKEYQMRVAKRIEEKWPQVKALGGGPIVTLTRPRDLEEEARQEEAAEKRRKSKMPLPNTLNSKEVFERMRVFCSWESCIYHIFYDGIDCQATFDICPILRDRRRK